MGHQRGMNFDASEAEHPRNCVHIHAEGQGYRLVRKALNVTEDDRGADSRRQKIECPMRVVPVDCLRGAPERQRGSRLSLAAARSRRPVEEHPRGDLKSDPHDPASDSNAAEGNSRVRIDGRGLASRPRVIPGAALAVTRGRLTR
jgi:hypothetical protein